MSGHATIWSFIVAHAPLPPAYAQMSPYNVIIVSLDEDPVLRMVSSLLDHPGGAVNEVNPATIQIGEPVKAVFCEQAGIWFPRFVRA
ncbi:MAG: OB-fold domain-containing protein [Actinobacteria bacterium]|nr:OB-fold domain-containing protein [Actinomycetota bacterium]